MEHMIAMPGKILVKKCEVQEESKGFLLNNEAEKFLSCGEVVENITFQISNPAVKDSEPISITWKAGDKVYYQKTKGYDTHLPEYQVVNLTDIIYVEEA